MKKVALMMLAACVAAVAMGGILLEPGLSGEFTEGAIVRGAHLASTNATQTGAVKAVYSWPVFGSVTVTNVETVSYLKEGVKVETLTNWCDWVTTSYVVKSGVTNYYDGITVATNAVLLTVEKPVTNVVTKAAVTGSVAVTNSLYTLNASGGVATNGETRIIGAGGRLLIESAAVTIFVE